MPSDAIFEDYTEDEYSFDFNCMEETRSYMEENEDKVVYYNYTCPFSKLYNTIFMPNIADSLCGDDAKMFQPRSTEVNRSPTAGLVQNLEVISTGRNPEQSVANLPSCSDNIIFSQRYSSLPNLTKSISSNETSSVSLDCVTVTGSDPLTPIVHRNQSTAQVQ